MKKLYTLILLVLLTSLLQSNISNAQVTVSGALVGNGNYTTLSAAFTAINGGTQTSANITISITANTIEPVTGAVLTPEAWTKITISPSGGLPRIVSANVNAGRSLIDLNGADNVIIDGLNSGGNSLTISNTTVSDMDGTCTILFGNEATHNVITNCSVLGSSIVGFEGDGGTISFGSFVSDNGNNNNVISYCNIGPAGSNLPNRAIGSVWFNSGDTIKNCNIYDYFSATGGSAGISLQNRPYNFVIENNKFYQTAPRIQTADGQHYAIWYNAPTMSNIFIVISGNTIGYSSPAGTGTYSISGMTNTKFYPIYIDFENFVGQVARIDGNIISNISLSGALSGTGENAPFAAMYIEEGPAQIGLLSGNTIGSMIDTSSILFSSSSSGNSDVNGIYVTGGAVCNCRNNSIGAITISNSGSGTSALYCVRASNENRFDFVNNTVGGTIANSIQNKTNGTGTMTTGFYNDDGGLFPGAISENTIRNLTSNGGTGLDDMASVSGIVILPDARDSLVSQNTIYNLKNTNASSSSVINGIYAAIDNTTILGNFIHTLMPGGDNSTINGIQVNGGTATYYNNMIQLGLDTSGSSINHGSSIVGIRENGGTNNFYFNSVYIGGTQTSGTSNSFAFRSIVTNNTRSYRNNIFFNARSFQGAGAGLHYAVSIAGTSPNPAGLTIDNNIYYANALLGGVLGLFHGQNRTNLSAWQSAVGQDSNSYSNNPHFKNPDGSSSKVDLHINANVATVVESNGFNIPSITFDYDGQQRHSLTPVDIGADAGLFTPQSKTFNLKMFIEGFYDPDSNKMVRDTVKVYFRHNTSPYAVVDSAFGYMNSNGTRTFTVSIAGGTSYYIQLKHRNSIETWSSTAQTFVNDTLTYHFTTAASQAYGNNMPQINTSPVTFGIYSGDVNQDGVVDGLDLELVDNGSFNFLTGYVAPDVNGDDVVDGSDAVIVENNAFNFVTAIVP